MNSMHARKAATQLLGEQKARGYSRQILSVCLQLSLSCVRTSSLHPAELLKRDHVAALCMSVPIAIL